MEEQAYRIRQRLGLSRRALTLTAAAGAAALLASCKTGKTASRTSGAGTKTASPAYGGQLNLAIKFDTVSFDPSKTPNHVPTQQVLALAADSLLGFKSGPNVQYSEISVEPRLAQRWEAPDAQTYIFHLRPDVKFANLPPVAGRTMTAQDVQWTYEYLTRLGDFKSLPPSPESQVFVGLARVDAPDTTTTVMNLKQPFAPFLTYAALPDGSILPREIFDQDGSFSKRLIGTGAWLWDDRASQKGAQEVYRKNPQYFVAGRPYIDQINRLVLPEDATIDAAFRSRQVDILDYSGISSDTADQMKKTLPGIVAYEYLQGQPARLYINVSKPPLDDVRIRRAIALAVDRDEILRAVVKGRGQWALAGSTPGLFSPDETRQILRRDPAQAKQLVSAAGYANGVSVELLYPSSSEGNALVTLVQLFQSQLKQANINIDLKGFDETTLGTRRKASDFQMNISNKAPFSDLDDYLYRDFAPTSSGDYGKVNDPELTSLLEAQRRETDTAKRKALWRQAVQRIADQAWSIAFFFPEAVNLWWPRLRDYAPNAGSVGEPVRNSWLLS